MTRTLLFLVKVGLVVAAAVWLADRPGQVEIVWQGYVVETSFGMLVLAALLLIVATVLLFLLWRGVRKAPIAIVRARSGSRRDRGLAALTNGMVAVAAGDSETARRLSRRADELLDDPPLTLLLSAQAAQLSGDDQAAHRKFEAMLQRRETEFLGLRGLLTEALRNQDIVRALSLAQRARKLRPETPWVLTTCFNLEVRLRRWAEAQHTLTHAVRAKAIDRDDAQRYAVAMLVEQSREQEGSGDADGALRLAHRATRMMPGFVPAVVREARLLARTGKERKARKLIERSWSAEPHRELVELYRDLGPADEPAEERVKRLDTLYRMHPEHPESLIAMGEAELRAERWSAAREHLMKAEPASLGRRVYRLLAELETAEANNAAAARDWLERAERAPAEPAWVCDRCGTVAPVWSALCGHCSAFASLEWRVPTAAVHLPAPEDEQRLLATA